MTIPSGLAAELHPLTQALDLPGTDIAETMIQLATDARSAVDSYLGLSVSIITNKSQFDFTFLAEDAQPEDIRATVRIPLSPAAEDDIATSTSVVLILYAANPGAFIDLAADLSWITGRSPEEFRFDEQLTFPASDSLPGPIATVTTINQALGVLVGRGLTPEQAAGDLHARALRAGIDLLGAATHVLVTLIPPAGVPEAL